MHEIFSFINKKKICDGIEKDIVDAKKELDMFYSTLRGTVSTVNHKIQILNNKKEKNPEYRQWQYESDIRKINSILDDSMNRENKLKDNIKTLEDLYDHELKCNHVSLD